MSDARDPGRLQELSIGFVYWLALVVVLEPGNVMRADGGLPLWPEVARLVAAGALGASITPAVFALARHRPIEGEGRWTRAAIHVAAATGLAVALIVVAGVLAWAVGFDRRPLAAAIADQLAIDGLLLFFAVAALDGIAHAVFFYRRAQSAADAPPEPAAGHLTRVAVKARGRLSLLDLAEVAWIEAQGNYLALHAGDATHLIRETLARFEAKLDPARFVRIHRGAIVAAPRIRTIAMLPGGDATVTLDDGSAVRMSRSYRDAVTARLSGTSPPADASARRSG
jgi:DNA-binding LytR/AlgR family response regulator